MTEKERRAQTPPDAAHDDDWVPEDDAVIGRAFRWSLIVAGVVLVVVLAGLGIAKLVRAEPVDRAIAADAPLAVERIASPPAVAFTDVTAASGVTFVHHNGAYGEKLLPETMGGGVAIVDYDGDSDQDLFFVDSTRWDESPPDVARGALALYENDGSGKFRDVSREKGVALSLYGTAVAAGDYDNDGDVDLFVAAVGANKLLRNEDGARFTDVTAEAGVAGDDEEWSSSSAFLDYDRDGDLDLLLINHAGPPRLFRNDGGNRNPWLRVAVEGTVSNRDGRGAKIRVQVDPEGPWQIREVGVGSHFLGEGELIQHFGIGPGFDPQVDTVARVEVEWPASGIVQTFEGVAGNQTLTVVEAE